MENFLKLLVVKTEDFLTWRSRRRYLKREKQKQKNVILDWIDAFIWSAMVVLLVNQYFFQAYEIPSGSMTDTLLIQDRLFVNKAVFGPELLPGLVKLPGPSKPERGDIIIFESPEYLSQGTLFDIAQRVLYMLTLSMVDIDRDKEGKPKVHFLIKRGVGFGGDTLRFREGFLEIKPQGEKDFIPEKDFQKMSGLSYHVTRLLDPSHYESLRKAARFSVNTALRLPVTADEQAAASSLGPLADRLGFDYERFKIEYSIAPQIPEAASNYVSREVGRYIPDGWILPLGDNRDNSRDGRYWGPVREEKVLGQAAFRFWPILRMGGVE